MSLCCVVCGFNSPASPDCLHAVTSHTQVCACCLQLRGQPAVRRQRGPRAQPACFLCCRVSCLPPLAWLPLIQGSVSELGLFSPACRAIPRSQLQASPLLEPLRHSILKKFLGKVTFVRGYVVWNCLSHSLPLLYKCVLSSKLSVLVGHWLYSRRSQHSWWRTAFLHNFDLTSLNANLALFTWA